MPQMYKTFCLQMNYLFKNIKIFYLCISPQTLFNYKPLLPANCHTQVQWELHEAPFELMYDSLKSILNINIFFFLHTPIVLLV